MMDEGRAGLMMSASYRAIERLDIESLESQARGSADGEAYLQVFRLDACRVGVTATVDKSGRASFSIEVLFTTVNTGTGELLSGLNDMVEMAKRLSERGYVIDHQGDGWLIAWKRLQPGGLEAEMTHLVSLVQKGEAGERDVETGE